MCNFSKYVGKCMKLMKTHLNTWINLRTTPPGTWGRYSQLSHWTKQILYLLEQKWSAIYICFLISKNVFWIWNILLNIQKNTARSMFLLTLMAGTLWASLVRLEMLEWIGSEPIDLSSDNWSIKLLIVLPVPVYCWTNGCELFCHSVRKLKYIEK